MRELQRMVDAGELGEILPVEGQFSNESAGRYYTGWRGADAESPAGGLTATGVHLLDAFVALAGPARRMHAHLVTRDPDPAPVDTLTVLVESATA
jgi:predicted dehydrogenase